jgi:hypothetical protein
VRFGPLGRKRPDQLLLAEAVMLLATWLKTLLMRVATTGTIAAAKSAEKLAINAHSKRSWPCVASQILSFQIRLTAVFTRFPHSEPEGAQSAALTLGSSRNGGCFRNCG